MMVLASIGILRLGCKAAGYTGYIALLNEYQSVWMLAQSNTIQEN